MYEVKLYDGPNDNQGITIQSPYINDNNLSSGKIKQVSKEIWQFTFAINIENEAWGRIRPMQSLVRVLNIKTGRQEFAGRILRPTQVMDNNGMFTVKYECESFLSYLLDSSQRHGEYRNITPRQFLQVILDNHNRQVEPHKQMKLGNVTVTNSTDNVYRYLGYEKTLDTIKDKLIDRLGGFLRLREEPDGFYLDYLESVGEVSSVDIRLRRNLRDMQREIDPRDVITRVVPLGARIESEDESAVDASQARITIADVNNGVDYLDIPDFQAEFGIIEGSITFDDVNTPSILKTRGEQFIASQHAALVKYKINPIDLFLIDQDMDTFEVDNYHRVVNEVFGIDETLQIVQKEINVLDATDISLTIGDTTKTLSEYQIDADKSAQRVVELQNTVDAQSRRIATIQNEFSTVENNMENLQQIIENADIPGLEGAISALEQSINDLNEALDGIPIYEPATPTQDGLMPAGDKSKLDRIRAQNNINLDLITITQAINLDQLYQDVQELKNS